MLAAIEEKTDIIIPIVSESLKESNANRSEQYRNDVLK